MWIKDFAIIHRKEEVFLAVFKKSEQGFGGNLVKVKFGFLKFLSLIFNARPGHFHCLPLFTVVGSWQAS